MKRVERKSNQNKAKTARNSYRKIVAHTEKPESVSAYGGLSLAHRIAGVVGFGKRVDDQVNVLKQYHGYTESDHLFNLVSSCYIGGTCMEDVSYLANDDVYKELIRSAKVSDPTTLGDFLRRFKRTDIDDYKKSCWQMQEVVWNRLGRRQRRRASLDLDSHIHAVYGNQKEGVDFNHKRVLSYHPEILSLAETHEFLEVINRPGNEVSGDSACQLLERNLPRVKKYFDWLCIRGDSKFGRYDVIKTAVKYGAHFCLCFAANGSMIKRAEALEEDKWSVLNRSADNLQVTTPVTRTRRRKANLRRQRARERGYTDKKLKQEEVAEFDYTPSTSARRLDKPYRIIVIRKLIEVAGKTGLFDSYKYHFIITDLDDKAAEVVTYCYGRCDQENLIEQGKNGVGAFRMPTSDLLSNEVYMISAMLAHNFKSWLCFLALGKEKLKWKWKRFRQAFVYFVIRVTKGARQVHCWLDESHRFTDTMINGLARLGIVTT